MLKCNALLGTLNPTAKQLQHDETIMEMVGIQAAGPLQIPFPNCGGWLDFTSALRAGPLLEKSARLPACACSDTRRIAAGARLTGSACSQLLAFASFSFQAGNSGGTRKAGFLAG